MLSMIERHRRIKGVTGELTASTAKHFHEARGPKDAPCEPRVLSAEQTNTSIAFGDRLNPANFSAAWIPGSIRTSK